MMQTNSDTTLPSSQQPWRERIVDHGHETPEDLLANPANWRRHPRHQQQALASVLGEVGLVQSVIVNRATGHLVDGHLRVELAIAAKQPQIPVVYVELSEEEERVILASLDPIAAMADADREKLGELLSGIENPDLAELLDEVARANRIALDLGSGGLTDPDAVPEPPEEPTTQTGDLWLLGEHRLLCGDSTKAEDVQRVMDGERAVLVPTDSPYIVGYSGGSHPQSWGNRGSAKRDKDWSADYAEAEVGSATEFFTAFLSQAVSEAATEDAAFYLWHASLRQPELAAAMRACGLLVHQQIIWAKSRAVLTHSHYLWSHEPALYGWREGHPPRRRPPADARSVWEVTSVIEDGANGLHPTTKPIELWKRPILYHTAPGELVYEPFSGSGTAIIAAEQTGRTCYAMELSPTFVDVAVERWQRFAGQQAQRVAKEARP